MPSSSEGAPTRGATLDSLLLASTDPDRLHAWYTGALAPDEDSQVGPYRVLRYGTFNLFLDQRDDVSATNPEPGRVVLNFDVADARAVVARLDALDATWLAELEDRDGNLFATAVDPDGNFVQIIELSEKERAALAAAS
jgi:hypothetical protein